MEGERGNEMEGVKEMEKGREEEVVEGMEGT